MSNNSGWFPTTCWEVSSFKHSALSRIGTLAFWRTFGKVGFAVLEIDPHPERTACPVCFSPCLGRVMGCTRLLNFKGELRTRRAMSCCATPLKWNKENYISGTRVSTDFIIGKQLRKIAARLSSYLVSFISRIEELSRRDYVSSFLIDEETTNEERLIHHFNNIINFNFNNIYDFYFIFFKDSINIPFFFLSFFSFQQTESSNFKLILS